MFTYKKIKQFILDIIFPVSCIGCLKESEWICRACLTTIKIQEKQVCPICREQTSKGSVCNTCKGSSDLSGLLIATSYDNQLIQKAILKNPENVVITAVPLHPKRKLERGFNQAALLARIIASHYSLHYVPDLLQRKRYTEMQANLDKQNRIANMHNAFQVKRGLNKIQKNVILIDDVATTLSTLNECAKALKKANCNQIWGLVVARGK